jgi:hypothetical protein
MLIPLVIDYLTTVGMCLLYQQKGRDYYKEQPCLSHDEAEENFYAHWTDASNPNGKVSKEEFFAFYAGQSSACLLNFFVFLAYPFICILFRLFPPCSKRAFVSL